jgi:hypothetical protein
LRSPRLRGSAFGRAGRHLLQCLDCTPHAARRHPATTPPAGGCPGLCPQSVVAAGPVCCFTVALVPSPPSFHRRHEAGRAAAARWPDRAALLRAALVRRLAPVPADFNSSHLSHWRCYLAVGPCGTCPVVPRPWIRRATTIRAVVANTPPLHTFLRCTGRPGESSEFDALEPGYDPARANTPVGVTASPGPSHSVCTAALLLHGTAAGHCIKLRCDRTPTAGPGRAAASTDRPGS